MMEKHLSVMNGLFEEGRLYVVDIDTWLFIEYDLSTGMCNLIADIQRNVDKDEKCWVKKIIHIKDCFFILFRNYQGLVSVSTSGVVNYYDRGNGFSGEGFFFYADASFFNELIYMLPGTTDGVITVFDPAMCQFVDDIPLAGMLCEKVVANGRNHIFSYAHSIEDSRVLFCMSNTKMVCDIDLSTMKGNVVEYEDEAYFKMVQGTFEHPIIISNSGFCLYGRSQEGNGVICMCNSQREPGDAEGYRIAICLDGLIMALDDDMNKIEIIKDGQLCDTVKMPKDSELVFQMRYYKQKFSTFIVDDKYILFLPFSANGLVRLDIESFETDFISLDIPKDYLSIKDMRRRNVVMENEDYSLNSYIFRNTRVVET